MNDYGANNLIGSIEVELDSFNRARKDLLDEFIDTWASDFSWSIEEWTNEEYLTIQKIWDSLNKDFLEFIETVNKDTTDDWDKLISIFRWKISEESNVINILNNKIEVALKPEWKSEEQELMEKYWYTTPKERLSAFFNKTSIFK